MKQKSFTVTSANLNSGEQIVDISGTVDSQTIIPTQLVIGNTCGATSLGYIILGSADELTERTTNQTYYSFVPFVGTTMSTIRIPDATYIILKVLTGSATGNLVFYATNYKYAKTA